MLLRRNDGDVEDGPCTIPEDALLQHEPMLPDVESDELEDPRRSRDIRPSPIREIRVRPVNDSSPRRTE